VTPISTAALMRLEADVEQFGPDFALWAFLGQFVGANEQAKVDAIIADRSIRVLLQQEHEKRTARLARSSSRKS